MTNNIGTSNPTVPPQTGILPATSPPALPPTLATTAPPIIVSNEPNHNNITNGSISEDESDGAFLDFDSFSSDDLPLDFTTEITDPNMIGATPPLLYQQHLRTICAFAVKCSHGSMPCSTLHGAKAAKRCGKESAIWLPYVAVKRCFRFDRVAALMSEFFLKEFGISYDRAKLLDGDMAPLFEKISLYSIDRIQIPSGEYVERLIYLASWRSTTNGANVAPACCRNTARIQWIPIWVAAESGAMLRDYHCGTASSSSSSMFSGLSKSKKSTNVSPKLQQQQQQQPQQYMELILRFWGSEVAEIAELYRADRAHRQLLNLTEHVGAEMLSKYFPANSGARTVEGGAGQSDFGGQFIAESGYTESDVVKLYSDYVQHCYPSINMSFHSFRDYLGKIGLGSIAFDDRTYRAIFRAMLPNIAHKYQPQPQQQQQTKQSVSAVVVKDYYLTFHDFLHGIIALDPASPNNSPRRIAFLFRYYDQNADGIVEAADFRRLLADLERSLPSPVANPQAANNNNNNNNKINNIATTTTTTTTTATATTTTTTTTTATTNTTTTNTINTNNNQLAIIELPGIKSMTSIEEFIAEIDARRLRESIGTLCRFAKRSIVRMAYESDAYEPISNENCAHHSGTFGGGKSAIISAAAAAAKCDANFCEKCRPKQFSLATHTVTISAMPTGGGKIEEIRPTTTTTIDQSTSPWSFDQIEKSGKSAEKENRTTRATRQQQCEQQQLRRHSIEYVFRASSPANQVLSIVRRFAGYTRMSEEKRRYTASAVKAALTATLIRTLCDDVTPIIAAQPRVLPLRSPLLVFGDLHGNIADLLTFEAQMWPAAPAVMPWSVLFLGDYVDRGEFGVEVVCYLFAMKLLAPDRFQLLRGNHELRQVQRTFTFERECRERYGVNGGPLLLEMINRSFDVLPFAAVVDDKIFCVHGGIPYSVSRIDDLTRAPVSLPAPDQEAPAVWEMLWADPISAQEYRQLVQICRPPPPPPPASPRSPTSEKPQSPQLTPPSSPLSSSQSPAAAVSLARKKEDGSICTAAAVAAAADEDESNDSDDEDDDKDDKNINLNNKTLNSTGTSAGTSTGTSTGTVHHHHNHREGFLENTKRSTGYFFTECATAQFLSRNKLTHIIRAHEVMPRGYKLDHRGTVVTIFSSSRYCDGTNEAAAVAIESNDGDEGTYLKILSFET